jgi:hypothetical protein
MATERVEEARGPFVLVNRLAVERGTGRGLRFRSSSMKPHRPTFASGVGTTNPETHAEWGHASG